MTCTRSLLGRPGLVQESKDALRLHIHKFTPSRAPVKRRGVLRAVKEAAEQRVQRFRSAHRPAKEWIPICVKGHTWYNPQASMCHAPLQGLAFATVDDSVWEDKYAELYGTLDFGASSAQVRMAYSHKALVTFALYLLNSEPPSWQRSHQNNPV